MVECKVMVGISEQGQTEVETRTRAGELMELLAASDVVPNQEDTGKTDVYNVSFVVKCSNCKGCLVSALKKNSIPFQFLSSASCKETQGK